MSQPDRQLEQLTAVLRDLNPELDELARARILARTNAAIDAGAHGGGSSRTRVRMLAAGGALLAAAAALLGVLQPWRVVEPAPSAQVRVPETRGAAREPANAPLAVVAPALSERAAPELVPYTISGARGRSLADERGKAVRVLEIPAGTSARAAVGAAVRLTLVGPARIELAGASDERVELVLARGQVAIDFAGGGDRQLQVRTAQANVRVVGTRFAVVAEAQDTRVGVEEGTVEVGRVAHGERVQSLTVGRGWRASTGAEGALAEPLRALLRAHGAGLQPPPSARGLLSIEGDGPPVRARLGDQLLGSTPVWALVPVGPVAVSLDAAGARSVLRTEVAASRTTALALEPAATSAAAPRPTASTPPTEDDAAALYGAAERALRDRDRVAAQRALERLIARFPRSAQAEPALYELAQLAASCAEQRPLLERYLVQYAHGRFAAGARERLTRCGAQP